MRPSKPASHVPLPLQAAGPAARRRWRRHLGALLTASLLVTLGPTGAWAQIERLPDLGSADGDELSATAERKLGDSVMRELHADGIVYDDAELTDFINRFGAASPARRRRAASPRVLHRPRPQHQRLRPAGWAHRRAHWPAGRRRQ